jgi:hypothetical protein
MKYLALFLFVIFTVSCSKKNDNKVSKITINLLDTSEVFIEDVAQDIMNVNIGPPGDTTIKFPTHFFITDKGIIVVDKFQNIIYTFDRKGVLKNQIKGLASNKDSFSQITDVLFDETNNTLEVLDLNTAKIYVYNPDGKFLKTVNIADPRYFGLNFGKAGNLYVSLAHRSRNVKQSNSLSIFEQTGNTVNYHAPAINTIPMVKTLDIAFSHQIENYKDSLYYFPLLDDKIYQVGLNQANPVYQIEVPAENKLTQKMREEPPVKDHFEYWKKMAEYKIMCDNSSLFINEKWVSFRFKYEAKHSYCNVFYSKKTGKTLQVSKFKSRADTAFTSSYRILAKYGDYFVAASPTYKPLNYGSPLIKPVVQSKRPPYEMTFRLTFFKLKDL